MNINNKILKKITRIENGIVYVEKCTGKLRLKYEIIILNILDQVRALTFVLVDTYTKLEIRKLIKQTNKYYQEHFEFLKDNIIKIKKLIENNDNEFDLYDVI